MLLCFNFGDGEFFSFSTFVTIEATRTGLLVAQRNHLLAIFVEGQDKDNPTITSTLTRESLRLYPRAISLVNRLLPHTFVALNRQARSR